MKKTIILFSLFLAFFNETKAQRTPAIYLLSEQTIDLNTTSDQDIDLAQISGGSTFAITDIVITNASVTPTNASDGEWWTSTGRSGLEEFYTNDNTTPSPILTLLSSPINFINTRLSYNGWYIFSAPLNIPSGASQFANNNSLYFSLGTANGSACTADMYIYGYILQARGCGCDTSTMQSTGNDIKSTCTNSISVYPNPANKDVTITLYGSGYTSYEIDDINGHYVVWDNLQPSDKDVSFKVNMADVPNGVYTLVVNGKNGTETRKIIINK